MTPPARVPLAAAIVLSVQYAIAAALLVYLAVSPRVRSELSVPLDYRPLATKGHSFDAPLKERVRTWVFWRDLMIYFIVFSFMGH